MGLLQLAKKAEAGSDPLNMIVTGSLLASWFAGYRPLPAEDLVQFGLALLMVLGGVRMWVRSLIHRDTLAASDLDPVKRKG